MDAFLSALPWACSELVRQTSLAHKKAATAALDAGPEHKRVHTRCQGASKSEGVMEYASIVLWTVSMKAVDDRDIGTENPSQDQVVQSDFRDQGQPTRQRDHESHTALRVHALIVGPVTLRRPYSVSITSPRPRARTSECQ